MNRRDFVFLASVAGLLPQTAFSEALNYKPGMLQERLDAGETLFLDFTASWCSTCRAQGKVLRKLKADNPAYESHITFIDIDWDVYGRSRMATNMKIPRRSTLVVFKGKDELGRIVAETRESKIKALMDAALAAATSQA